MTSVSPINAKKTLSERAAGWRRAMQDADSGPLVIAKEVIEISENWESYKAEAQGMTINGWLQRTFGKGRTISWWAHRDEAVEALGEVSRRTFNHEVAVWLVGYVPADKLSEAKFAIMNGRKKNGDNCLTIHQARLIIERMLGATKEPRRCAKCAEKDDRIAELESTIRAAGVAVPE